MITENDLHADDGAREFRDPPRTLFAALRSIGPGLILAGAIVGTGELIQTTHLGARAGFTLLWLVVLSCFIKVFVQIELGRYTVSSGVTTFEAFRRLPGPGLLLVLWCAFMVVVTQFQIGAMIGGVGQALHQVAPALNSTLRPAAATRPELPWAVLITLITAAVLVTGSYRLIERAMTVLVVCFTVVTITCVVALPPQFAVSWSDLGAGFTFRVPRAAIGAAFAMLGITGVGATELLIYPYWCFEKGYARATGSPGSPGWLERARGWLAVMRLDAWISMVLYTVSTLAFFLLGAAVLHQNTAGEGLPGTVAELLAVLSRMYEPVMGVRGSQWFLVIGAFAVLYSTLFAATAGSSRLLADFLIVCGLVPGRDQATRTRWTRVFCLALPLLGLALFVAVANPVLMVTIGGMIQALSLPPIAAAAVYLRYRQTDPQLQPGRLWDVLLWSSLLVLTVAAGYLLFASLSKLW